MHDHLTNIVTVVVRFQGLTGPTAQILKLHFMRDTPIVFIWNSW